MDLWVSWGGMRTERDCSTLPSFYAASLSLAGVGGSNFRTLLGKARVSRARGGLGIGIIEDRVRTLITISRPEFASALYIFI